MEIVFVAKTFDDIQLLFADIIINITFDKFALKVFHHFAYNQKISNLLIDSYLLGLSNDYILLDNIKSINFIILWKHFLEFELHIYKSRSAVNNFIQLW